MYAVSELYNTIVAQDDHRFEVRVGIQGASFHYMNKILSMATSFRVFSADQPAVGGCLSGELDVTLLAPTSPVARMAKVRPQVRATNGTQTSEWIPQGVFYVDTRETTNNDDGLAVLTLHCYDDMLRTEADYPSTTHDWPMTDIQVVEEIADTIGVDVDPRTTALMDKGYSIGLPVGYSMREVLSNIAAMYAGNFIMNYDGQLRLVTLAELPAETSYLVDQQNDAITFGGDRILV